MPLKFPVFWIKLTILIKETWEKKKKKEEKGLGVFWTGVDEDGGGGVNPEPLKSTINIPDKQPCSPIPFVMWTDEIPTGKSWGTLST